MIPESVQKIHPDAEFTKGKVRTSQYRTEQNEKISYAAYTSSAGNVIQYNSGSRRFTYPEGSQISYTVNYNYDAGEVEFWFELTSNLDLQVDGDDWSPSEIEEFIPAILNIDLRNMSAWGEDYDKLLKAIEANPLFVPDSRLDVMYAQAMFDVEHSEYQVKSNEWFFAETYYFGIIDGHIYFSLTPQTEHIFSRYLLELLDLKFDLPLYLDEITDNNFSVNEDDMEKVITDLEALGFVHSKDLDR